MQLTSVHSTHRDVPVLQYLGELDIDSVAAMRTELENLLARGGPAAVLDLTKVTFIDSAALKVLDEGHKRAGEAGIQLSFVCPPGPVLRLLEIVGLDTRFTIRPDLDTATGVSGG